MQLIVYTERTSPRLAYTLATVLPAMGYGQYRVTASRDEYHAAAMPKLNYSAEAIVPGELHIVPASLLFEQSIEPQNIQMGQWNNLPIYFETTGGSVPFDVLAASFYLVSRYEEYLPHTKDMYGRFAHTESLAFKHNFLHLPLVNLWLVQLGRLLQSQGGSTPMLPVFSYVPTYDVDIAWSYLGKGWLRNVAAFVRSVLTLNVHGLREQLRVLLAYDEDPFDIYAWLDELHERHSLNPVYFFLVARPRGRYDKNISPRARYYRMLVSKLANLYTVGLHPSWRSGDEPALLPKELERLNFMALKQVTCNRQHYIRMTLPNTYTQLLEAGIRDDYSMGYGSINGFRASFCMPFTWYNLVAEQATDLTIYPFCYMEANSIFEQRDTPEQALAELQQYHDLLKSCGGTLITIFHNHLLSRRPVQQPWREMYRKFLEHNF